MVISPMQITIAEFIHNCHFDVLCLIALWNFNCMHYKQVAGYSFIACKMNENLNWWKKCCNLHCILRKKNYWTLLHLISDIWVCVLIMYEYCLIKCNVNITVHRWFIQIFCIDYFVACWLLPLLKKILELCDSVSYFKVTSFITNIKDCCEQSINVRPEPRIFFCLYQNFTKIY